MARVRDWNIKYGGSQLYRFKFKLNINKLAFAKAPFYENMTDIMEGRKRLNDLIWKKVEGVLK